MDRQRSAGYFQVRRLRDYGMAAVGRTLDKLEMSAKCRYCCKSLFDVANENS
jgi:hypothetical protein